MREPLNNVVRKCLKKLKKDYHKLKINIKKQDKVEKYGHFLDAVLGYKPATSPGVIIDYTKTAWL